MDSKEIDDRLQVHQMTDGEKSKSASFRGNVIGLAYEMNEFLPDCREKSLAMTKLEEVIMWFNKGLSRIDIP